MAIQVCSSNQATYYDCGYYSLKEYQVSKQDQSGRVVKYRLWGQMELDSNPSPAVNLQLTLGLAFNPLRLWGRL